MMTNLETDLKKIVMPLTHGFSWLQEVILLSKITKVSNMEGSFENDAVILFAYFFPLFKSWDETKRKLRTDLKKTVMPLTYGFSCLQEVILYSKITKVSNMEGPFENDAVILFAYFFPLFNSWD